MKIVLIGSQGTVGKHARTALEGKGREIISVGKKSGDFQVEMEKPQDIARLYKQIGNFDALVCAAGNVIFAPLASLKESQWQSSLESKLLGQIYLVQEALPYIKDKGSFTLITGVLADEHIASGTIASTVNAALEGFIKAASCELPRGLRINGVSPTLLEDSLGVYGDYFPGFIPVSGDKVGQAFKKSVLGIETGKIFHVL